MIAYWEAAVARTTTAARRPYGALMARDTQELWAQTNLSNDSLRRRHNPTALAAVIAFRIAGLLRPGHSPVRTRRSSRMTTLKVRRVPRSGSSALAAGALVQAILGIEFVLGGLNKLADPQYGAHFRDFMSSSAGLVGGPLAALVRWLVLPNVTVMAQLARFTELSAGLVLVLAAAEVTRRRFSGRLGARHGYEPAVALAGALAALVLGGLSLTIYLLQGGGPPRVNAGLAFGPPIPIELFNVPVALAVAWMELGRLGALRQAAGPEPKPPAPGRVPKAIVAGLLVLALAACGGSGGSASGGGQPAGSTRVSMSDFKYT